MPLRDILKSLFRDPIVILIEVIWRWIFAASALSLIAFAIFRLEHAVAIFPEEQEMLASKAPLQIVQALLEIWVRVRPAALRLGVIVIPAILVLWVIAATLGRGFVMTRLMARDSTSPRWSSLTFLHLLRVLSVLLLVAAYFACSFATAAVSNPTEPNYALAILVFLFLFATAVAIWSFLHWVLSLACIYSSRQSLSVFKGLQATLQLARQRFRTLVSISSQNASLRTAAAIVFTFLALPPLVTYRIPPLFWTLELAILLAYCLLSDVLLLARLAAYIEISERPQEPISTSEN